MEALLFLLAGLAVGDAVAQQRIDLLVQLVERGNTVFAQVPQFLDCFHHRLPGVAPAIQVGGQVFLVDRFIELVVQIPDVVVVQVVDQAVLDQALLGLELATHNDAHAASFPKGRRTRPVNRSSIAPSFNRSTFARSSASKRISSSMPDNTSMIACCSSREGR